MFIDDVDGLWMQSLGSCHVYYESKNTYTYGEMLFTGREQPRYKEVIKVYL